VALNSDDSCRRLKGPDRPLLRLWDRKFLLAALETVDHVLVFETEEELLTLIRASRPDLIVKGEEYAGHPIAGSDLAPVRLLPRRVEISTTAILGRLVNSCGSLDAARAFANRSRVHLAPTSSLLAAEPVCTRPEPALQSTVVATDA
jgi:hypothetical protein